MDQPETSVANGGRSASQPAAPAGGLAAYILGIALLTICGGSSLMLVLEHLVGLGLPGCGPGSPCAQAGESVWGKVPVIDWPVSFLGLAYFLGLLLTWLTLRGGIPAPLRMLVRLGVLLSIGFVAVMIFGGYVCSYCLVTHVANFVFWILVEFAARPPRPNWRPLLSVAGAFVVASAVLGAAEWRVRQAALTVAEKESQASGQAILAAATQTAPATSPTTHASVNPPPSGVTSAPAPRGFTGRYRLGPELTTTRIVIFTDYHCKGCHLIELELRAAFEKGLEFSVSVKHWPGDPECNPYSGDRRHIGACAAARAAEAAGLLQGNDAFWKMHFWLFDHNGRFTMDELRAAATEFGYDPAEFEQVMDSDRVRQFVQADIDEGFALGLRSTPMLLVNGHEFRGWSAPLTLTRLIEQIAKTDLTPRTAEHDRPLPALESFIADWRAARVRELPAGGETWPRGSGEAAIKIVVWGDYQQPNTALADGIIRAFAAEHADTQYAFHSFPLNPACNSAAKEPEFPLACRAAQAAKAAGELGGADGYWKMHTWLLQNQAGFSDETLRTALPELGFDPGAFFAALEDPRVSAAIAADAQAGQELGLQNSPLMFINGKLVPRWLHGTEPLLRPILDAAASDSPEP